MKFNKLLVGIILMLIQANGFLFAQTKFESERLALATQFAQAIKQGNLSNAEIMKKYVVEGGYFELDSIKNWADFYLNETRRSLKLSTDQSILIFKYLGREDKYSVTDHPIDQPERKLKLEFKLYEDITAVKPIEKKINMNDLYIVEFIYKDQYETANSKIFILFNQRNKILSFADFRMNNHVTLYKF
ncbi:MAG: hypothetical protein ACK5RG_10085 [Cyclobacteriaceae bacterium]|jgi:hypothetical protein